MIFRAIFFVLAYATILFAQNEVPGKLLNIWKDAGLSKTRTPLYSNNMLDITKFGNGNYFDDALKKAVKKAKEEKKRIIFFPAGTYKFKKPVRIEYSVLLKGEGADKTHLKFAIGSANKSAITFKGTGLGITDLKKPVAAGQDYIDISGADKKLAKAKYVMLHQGTDEWGSSSSGNKKFRKGQIFRVIKSEENKIYLDTPVRLDYALKDADGNPLKLQIMRSIPHAGLEDLSIERINGNPQSGFYLAYFAYAVESVVSGVHFVKGSNNHLSLDYCKNIAVSGNYFNDAPNHSGGGNGYGVNVGSLTSDCLIENNIFQKLRHSMIIGSSASGNVFAYNASFNKPSGNWDEADISLHGHYPYYNLFEANYVEYIKADHVWGANGPYNTFFRNYVYGDGLFGFMNSKELEIQNYTNHAIIIGNRAKVKRKGSGHIVKHNSSDNSNVNSASYQPASLYRNSPPRFLKNKKAFPGYGPKAAGQTKSVNTIPAKERFSKAVKTVKGNKILKRKVKRKDTKGIE